MRKVGYLVFSLFLVSFLSGCGTSLYKDMGAASVTFHPDGSKTIAESGVASVARQQFADRAACRAAQAVKPEPISCVGLSEMNCFMLKMQETNVRMQEQTAKLLAAATGHNYDPCAGDTTLFDVAKEEVIQKNQSARSLGSDFFGFAKFLAGVWGVKEVTQTVAKQAGQHVTVQGNEGDVSVPLTRTSSEVTETATAVGGDSPATTGGGSGQVPGITPVTTPTTTTTVVPTTTTVN